MCLLLLLCIEAGHTWHGLFPLPLRTIETERSSATPSLTDSRQPSPTLPVWVWISARWAFVRVLGKLRRALWSASLASRNQAMRDVRSAAGACAHVTAAVTHARQQVACERASAGPTSNSVRVPSLPSSGVHAAMQPASWRHPSVHATRQQVQEYTSMVR